MQQRKADVLQEKKLADAIGQLNITLTNIGDLQKALAKLKEEEFSFLPGTRMLKVHTHLRTNGRKPTTACPEIILRGNWLEKAGFHCDDQWVHVITMNEMIIITPASKMRSR
jgi:hypothetical protein